MENVKARIAVALTAVLSATAAWAAPTTAGPAIRTSVWVNVAVATLWTSPTAPRPVDAKATSAPVDIRGWLAAMSTSTRRGLVGRVETQALYGDRLVVTGVKPGWLHVAVPTQPSHRDSRGYPGWVPERQVTPTAPESTASIATVTSLTSWLRSASGTKVVEVSFGTRLPVLASTSSAVTVATPTHHRLVVPARDVIRGSPGAAALPRTATSVLASARTFLGKPYLWGGRSGFAVDCSGFTSLVFAVHGVVVPRDADDQATAGQAASLNALRPADLLFFRSGGTVDHVGFFLGSGRMLHAPHTGTVVQVGDMGQPASARRVFSANAAHSG